MANLLKREEIELISLFDENIVSSYNFSELEIELRLGLSNPQFGGDSNLINYTQFKNISNYLDKLDLARVEKNQKSLDIFINKTEKVNLNDNLNNLRFTIFNMDDISRYCNTGNLPSKHEVLFKGDFNWEHTSTNLTKFSSTLKNKRCLIDLKSYHARLAGKIEILVKESDKVKPWSKIISSIDDKILVNLSDVASTTYDMATSLINKNGFDKLYKTYRLKDRSTYYINLNNNFDVKVDLSKIKNSKSRINEYGYEEQIAVQNFIDSNLAESNESYEVEFEFIRLNPIMNNEFKKTFIDFTNNYLNKILEACYDIPKFTSFVEKNDVLYIYSNIVKNTLVDKINYKNDILEDVEEYRELKTSENNSDKIQKLINKYPNQYDYFNLIKDIPTPIEQIKMQNEKQMSNIEYKFKKGDYQRYFMSPKVVSISMDDVRPENPNSIISDYSVTEKADGVGMLLFKIGLSDLTYEDSKRYIDYKNRIYLIDSNMNVINTGIQLNDEFEIKGCILINGEYLRYGRGEIASKRPIINKYGIFDTYIYDNKDICNLPLITNDNVNTRLSYANKFIDLLNKYTKHNETNIDIFVKEFLISTNISTIFDKTKLIWNKYKAGLTNYKLDGTIYTPIYAPVGFKDNDYNYDLNIANTWKMNLKWKPAEDNTIDFLVKFEKEDVASLGSRVLKQDKIKTIISRNQSVIETKKYKIGNLFNGGQEVIKTNPCSNKENERKIGPQKPILFKPKHPLDEDIYFGYFPCDFQTNKLIVSDLEGEVVQDNTIVEVSYTGFDNKLNDYEQNKNLRWKILRTRHDKTFSYRLGLLEQKKAFDMIQNAIRLVNNNVNLNDNQMRLFDKVLKYIRDIPQVKSSINNINSNFDIFKRNIKTISDKIQNPSDINIDKMNFGNNINIAENIWMSIHNPVTEEIITTGQNIPTIPDEEDKYYVKSYQQQHRDKSITISLQDFHNKFIKNKLLIGSVVNYLRSGDIKHISLLDLACGKGGDISKWRDNEIDICVGIDSVKNNIYDENDGACERHQFYKNQKIYKGKMPDIHFLVGDVSKTFDDESAFSDLQSKILYKKLWYPDVELNTRFKDKGFNIISIMFALHYFFQNKSSLNNLINNISKNLKKGGFLIGCCFDGARVFELLKDLPYKADHKINLSGKNILRIIKNYIVEDNKFKDDETSISLPIGVYIYAIGKVHEEFLVNFKYFASELEKVGIHQVKENELKEMNLPTYSNTSYASFEDAYKFMYKNYANEPLTQDIIKNMTDEEKKVSFLNNYFIFRKETETESLINRIVNTITIKLQSRKDIIEWAIVNKWTEIRKIIKAEIGDIDDDSWTYAINKIKEGITSGNIIVQKPTKKIAIKKDVKKIIEETKEIPEIKTVTVNAPKMYEDEYEDENSEPVMVIEDETNEPVMEIDEDENNEPVMNIEDETTEPIMKINDEDETTEPVMKINEDDSNTKTIKIDTSAEKTVIPKKIKNLNIVKKYKKISETEKNEFKKIYDQLSSTLNKKGYLNPDVTSMPKKYKDTIKAFIDKFSDEKYKNDSDINVYLTKLSDILDRIN